MNKKFIPYNVGQCMPNPYAMPLPPIIPRRLAEAYVADQPYTGLLPINLALKKGTIFPNMLASFPPISKE